MFCVCCIHIELTTEYIGVHTNVPALWYLRGINTFNVFLFCMTQVEVYIYIYIYIQVYHIKILLLSMVIHHIDYITAAFSLYLPLTGYFANLQEFWGVNSFFLLNVSCVIIKAKLQGHYSFRKVNYFKNKVMSTFKPNTWTVIWRRYFTRYRTF